MTFVEEDDRSQAKLTLKMRTWWLGKTIELEMSGPAGSINAFAKEHIPVGTKYFLLRKKDGLETK